MIVNNTHIIFISANIRTCIGLRSLQRIDTYPNNTDPLNNGETKP